MKHSRNLRRLIKVIHLDVKDLLNERESEIKYWITVVVWFNLLSIYFNV